MNAKHLYWTSGAGHNQGAMPGQGVVKLSEETGNSQWVGKRDNWGQSNPSFDLAMHLPGKQGEHARKLVWGLYHHTSALFCYFFKLFFFFYGCPVNIAITLLTHLLSLRPLPPFFFFPPCLGNIIKRPCTRPWAFPFFHHIVRVFREKYSFSGIGLFLSLSVASHCVTVQFLLSFHPFLVSPPSPFPLLLCLSLFFPPHILPSFSGGSQCTPPPAHLFWSYSICPWVFLQP